jgi:hypothetical protein
MADALRFLPALLFGAGLAAVRSFELTGAYGLLVIGAAAGEPGRKLTGPSAALGISTASGILATSGISTLLLALLPALLALFPPLLPCLPVLLALLPALLALFLALLTIRGLVPVLPTTATLAIALASGSVSAFAVPAWLVASVSSIPPAHEFLLVGSIAQNDSVSCTRSGTSVTPAGISVSGAVGRA